MATKESNRVQKQRRENFDRVSVLIGKGGNKLLRVLALREGVSIAEYVRRAILARAGLRELPDHLDDLDTVETVVEADEAVLQLRENEAPDTTTYQVPLTSKEWDTLLHVAQQIDDGLYAASKTEWEAGGPPVIGTMTVPIAGTELDTIRQMLARIEAPPSDDEDGDIND